MGINYLSVSSNTDKLAALSQDVLAATRSGSVGLSFGETLRLRSFTTSAPFQYNIQNNTVAPDFNFPLDFAMAGADQTKGLIPGESENFTWILTMADGTPVSGVSAMDIAQHQVVRFRLLPTATGTDLALGPSIAIPEPATGAIAGMALLVMVMTAWRRRASMGGVQADFFRTSWFQACPRTRIRPLTFGEPEVANANRLTRDKSGRVSNQMKRSSVESERQR